MADDLLTCDKAPCVSCPYRRDVPSGVWDETEYAKLTQYDGDMGTQAMNGGLGLFLCHQGTGKLCAGWVAAHGPEELLALRFGASQVDPAVFSYTTDVPVFASGAEACAHGMKEIEAPGSDARSTINRLVRKGVGRS